MTLKFPVDARKLEGALLYDIRQTEALGFQNLFFLTCRGVYMLSGPRTFVVLDSEGPEFRGRDITSIKVDCGRRILTWQFGLGGQKSPLILTFISSGPITPFNGFEDCPVKFRPVPEHAVQGADPFTVTHSPESY